jgi:NADH-quinone oxidoreductase subunit J
LGTAFLFWILASAAVAGAVGVVALRQPIHSALSLLVCLLSVAGIFVLNHAEFLFAVQILVYTGGIMVLFLFTIMLVNIRRQAHEPFLHSRAAGALLIGVLFFAIVGSAVVGEMRRQTALDLREPAGTEALTTTVIKEKVRGEIRETSVLGNSQAVSWSLYRDYLIPFEVASDFLLVAMIGAVVLGKRTMERID